MRDERPIEERLPPKRVASAARAASAMRLRAAGFSWREIAKKCGYPDERAAYQAARNQIKHGIRESASELVEVEKTTLERLQRKAWQMLDKAKTPKDVATCVLSILRIQNRRAKLLGLDAPTKLAVMEAEVEKLSKESGIPVEELHRQAAEIAEAAWGKQR